MFKLIVGKFGQRTTLDSYEYFDEWNRLLLNLTNDKIQTNSWHIINDGLVELRYTEDIDYHIEAEYISEVTAVFTTANARIRLMSMLHWLHPSQVIYCDTDSVFSHTMKLTLNIKCLIIMIKLNQLMLVLVML